jgi:hypothetical protein
MAEIFMRKRKLSVNNPWKVIIFHDLYHGKACLSTELPSERQNSPGSILQKGMPFCAAIRGKFWLSADYRYRVKHTFQWNDPPTVLTFYNLIRRKPKLFEDYLSESFSEWQKVKISLFKGHSLF